jgi:hydrogenase/urease accessory protein HupE
MENFIKNNQENKQLGLGILLLVIGGIFMLRNTGLDIPHWILSWHTAMLGVGLWLGYRKNFESGSWLAIAIIGGIFTLKDISLFDFDLSRITTALVLIGLGLYVILKPKKIKTFDQFSQNSDPKKEGINF